MRMGRLYAHLQLYVAQIDRAEQSGLHKEQMHHEVGPVGLSQFLLGKCFHLTKLQPLLANDLIQYASVLGSNVLGD